MHADLAAIGLYDDRTLRLYHQQEAKDQQAKEKQAKDQEAKEQQAKTQPQPADSTGQVVEQEDEPMELQENNSYSEWAREQQIKADDELLVALQAGTLSWLDITEHGKLIKATLVKLGLQSQNESQLLKPQLTGTEEQQDVATAAYIDHFPDIQGTQHADAVWKQASRGAHFIDIGAILTNCNHTRGLLRSDEDKIWVDFPSATSSNYYHTNMLESLPSIKDQLKMALENLRGEPGLPPNTMPVVPLATRD